MSRCRPASGQKKWTSWLYQKADGIGSQLPAARGNIAYIGPVPERALGLDIPADKLNPKGVLDFLHYYRAYKTDYELYCMREAQKRR